MKMVYLLWHEVLSTICNVLDIWMNFMFKAWGGGVGKGREQGGWVACFITPQWLFMLLNLKFLSIPRWHIFFCVVKRMFLIWPCIFCIGSRQHFYKRKKKIRRVLVLIKRYQCLKWCAAVTWSKNMVSLCSLVLLGDGTEFINSYLLSNSLCLFTMLNTLAGLNLPASSCAADTRQTHKGRKVSRRGKNTVQM